MCDFSKWLVKYAAFNLGRRNKVGKNGVTSFEIVTGAPYTGVLFEPGEVVMARVPRPAAAADKAQLPVALEGVTVLEGGQGKPEPNKRAGDKKPTAAAKKKAARKS